MPEENKIEIVTDKSAKYYEMYEEALNFHKNRFDEYTELAAYYELQQDNLKSMTTKPWVYQINTPFATDAINLRVASLQANDYTGELEPLSPEDEEDILNLNKVYHEFWRDMNMDKVIDDSILTGAVLGNTYTHIIMDSSTSYGGKNRKNKGKLVSYFLDPSSVQIDPKAFNLATADYICVNERFTKRQIKNKYKDFDFENIKQSDAPDYRGEIYAGNDYTTYQDDKVFNRITIYEKTNDGIEKTVLIERTIVEEPKLLEIKKFPIAQFRWQKRLKSPYGTSLMQMLLPLQKVLNEIESANANANMQYSSPSYALSEDSGIDPEELALNAGAPASVYVVASGIRLSEAIAPLLPNRGIDQGLVTTKQELERSIYKLAGINDAFQGDIGTSGNTATGADVAVQRAKTIEERVLTNIEEYVEDLTHIIVEYIKAGFAGETLYARGEKRTDGHYDYKNMQIPEDSKELEYNFSIELNIKTQYSKEQQKTQMRELFEVERQYDTGDVKILNTLDIIKTLNIPQTDELIERYLHITKLDASQRAQMVSEIVLTAQQLGLDPNLANEAISEIIMNRKETPMLEQFMQMAEQTRIQEEQAQQTVTNAVTSKEIEANEALMNQEFTPEM